MARSIIATHIRADNRTPGRAGLVIADFEYDDGVQERCVKSAPADIDAETHLSGLISEREAGCVRSEILGNMREIATKGRFAEVTISASTVDQNASALRTLYQEATREQAIMMGDYLNTLPDNILRNAFSLSQGQVNNLRSSKLEPAAALADSIRAEAGV